MSERDINDVRHLQPLLRRMNTAENDGDVGDMTGLLADDGVIMVPNHPVSGGQGGRRRVPGQHHLRTPRRTRYTAAWCSHDSARVASFDADDGSLTINEGTP